MIRDHTVNRWTSNAELADPNLENDSNTGLLKGEAGPHKAKN